MTIRLIPFWILTAGGRKVVWSYSCIQSSLAQEKTTIIYLESKSNQIYFKNIQIVVVSILKFNMKSVSLLLLLLIYGLLQRFLWQKQYRSRLSPYLWARQRAEFVVEHPRPVRFPSSNTGSMFEMFSGFTFIEFSEAGIVSAGSRVTFCHF